MSTKHSFIIIGILGFFCFMMLPGKSLATPQTDLTTAESDLAAAKAELTTKTAEYQQAVTDNAQKQALPSLDPSVKAAAAQAVTNKMAEITAINARILDANQRITGAQGRGAIQAPAQVGQGTPAGSGSTGTLTEKSITNFLTWVAKQAITFVLVIAAIFIMLAGYIYITSLGNTAKVEQAKQMLLYILIGVLVVLGAYIVVKTFLGQVTNP